MFQNIINEQQEKEEVDNQKINIKSMLNINDIILAMITCIISMVSFNGNLAPFGLAMFAATCSNCIPAGIVYIASAVGTLIGFGFSGFLEFVLTSLFFIIGIILIRPTQIRHSQNEQRPLGKYVFISTLVLQIGKMLFGIFLVYDLIVAVMTAIITYIFYKIFANSIPVIQEISFKKVFSIEEVMGASLIFSIASVAFSRISIFGLSITNIFSIMLVLVLGWQNGILAGGTAGITIGMVLGIITNSSPILIASFAISGMLAGFLNRLGKWGVIIGFCLGNAWLTYIANGNTVPIITIREILIASLGLLILPKKIKINISDILTDDKCLPTTAGAIEGKVETISKLNTVSETISEMAQSFNEAAVTTLENENIEVENLKDIFIENMLNGMEEYIDNFLYDEIVTEDTSILEDIYIKVSKQEEFDKSDLISIFEKHNNYIVQPDDDENSSIYKDIKQIVRLVNSTYKINKLNAMWKQKEANNKKELAKQLGGVSKVISSIAENIEGNKEYEKNEENYKIKVGKAFTKKYDSDISGDSFCDIRLKDGKYMLALSDGMGSGTNAKKSSSTVIQMLKKLLTSGFDKNVSIGLINSAVNLNSNDETYATIDISIIDLHDANLEIIKNGAGPTFIKSGEKTELIKAVSLPAGILEKIDLVVYDKDLKKDDIIIMCSDGIIEAFENKEIWLKEIIEKMETKEPQKMADIILQEAIDNNLGKANDDMTILVAKIE